MTYQEAQAAYDDMQPPEYYEDKPYQSTYTLPHEEDEYDNIYQQKD